MIREFSSHAELEPEPQRCDAPVWGDSNAPRTFRCLFAGIRGQRSVFALFFSLLLLYFHLNCSLRSKPAHPPGLQRCLPPARARARAHAQLAAGGAGAGPNRHLEPGAKENSSRSARPRETGGPGSVREPAGRAQPRQFKNKPQSRFPSPGAGPAPGGR